MSVALSVIITSLGFSFSFVFVFTSASDFCCFSAQATQTHTHIYPNTGNNRHYLLCCVFLLHCALPATTTAFSNAIFSLSELFAMPEGQVCRHTYMPICTPVSAVVPYCPCCFHLLSSVLLWLHIVWALSLLLFKMRGVLCDCDKLLSCLT